MLITPLFEVECSHQNYKYTWIKLSSWSSRCCAAKRPIVCPSSGTNKREGLWNIRDWSFDGDTWDSYRLKATYPLTLNIHFGRWRLEGTCISKWSSIWRRHQNKQAWMHSPCSEGNRKEWKLLINDVVYPTMLVNDGETKYSIIGLPDMIKSESPEFSIVSNFFFSLFYRCHAL